MWRTCPVLLLVAAVVMGVAIGAAGQCWEHPSCQEVNSESSMMECIQLCRSDLSAETPLIPGDAHLQPPALSDSSSIVPLPDSSPQNKRSYSMEHFRWGKPVGRKRRPIKVYAPNGMEEESAEVFPGEMRRRELADELLAAAEEEVMEAERQLVGGVQDRKHFGWSGPAAIKRYGGFMKSWDERSQRPLLTLFKNVINKDGQQQ